MKKCQDNLIEIGDLYQLVLLMKKLIGEMKNDWQTVVENLS